MEIIDTVKCSRKSYPVAYFHLSPGVKVLSVESDRVVTDKAVFIFKGYKTITLSQEYVSKEYNLLQDSVCLQVSFKDTLHTIIEGFC